jgi:hypothetical protein
VRAATDPTLSFAKAQEAYASFRRPLLEPSVRKNIEGALSNSSGKAFMEEANKGLAGMIPKVRSLLVRGGVQEKAPLLDVLIRSFSIFTLLNQVATQKASVTDSWICNCYGLELLCSRA